MSEAERSMSDIIAEHNDCENLKDIMLFNHPCNYQSKLSL